MLVSIIDGHSEDHGLVPFVGRLIRLLLPCNPLFSPRFQVLLALSLVCKGFDVHLRELVSSLLDSISDILKTYVLLKLLGDSF